MKRSSGKPSKVFATIKDILNLLIPTTSGYDMDGDGEISTREFKLVMKRSNKLYVL